jgi:hypothetical protein
MVCAAVKGQDRAHRPSTRSACALLSISSRFSCEIEIEGGVHHTSAYTSSARSSIPPPGHKRDESYTDSAQEYTLWLLQFCCTWRTCVAITIVSLRETQRHRAILHRAIMSEMPLVTTPAVALCAPDSLASLHSSENVFHCPLIRLIDLWAPYST